MIARAPKMTNKPSGICLVIVGRLDESSLKINTEMLLFCKKQSYKLKISMLLFFTSANFYPKLAYKSSTDIPVKKK